MGALSGVHWLIIAIVAAFLFFGWKQLPDMARSMGRSLRVFKTEIKGMTDDDAARNKSKDGAPAQAAEQELRQLAPRPAPATEQRQPPRADVVRNAAAPSPARSAQGARPRPAPGTRSHN